MIKNYLKSASRNFRKSKLYSVINIIGLSAGMAVAILIGLWIHDETTYDRNIGEHERIAQVIQNVTNNGEVQTWFNVPFPLADELRTHYGGDFRYIVMAANWDNHLVTIGDKKVNSHGGFFEEDAPNLFGLNMISGDRSTLKDPSAVFISVRAAKAFFGNEDPMNKTIVINQLPPVRVAGVYRDLPQNSSFADLDFMATWKLYYDNSGWIGSSTDIWRPNFVSLFVQLSEGADFASASAHIRDAKLKKVNPQLAQKKPQLFLHPMDKWHLYNEFRNGVNTGGAIRYVRMFGAIGFFVLLLACINFMNLSTARSEKRAKEVGIRKTIGSVRKQLIYQFFTESIFTSLLAFIFSLLLVQLTLPFFNEVSNKNIGILWTQPLFWTACISFALLTGLIAGSYPAFYLSSFKPIQVLKGTFKAGRLAALPRKVLVVLQFTVSVSLIIGTFIVYRQIQFAKDRPVGYSRDRLVSIYLYSDKIHEHFDALKEDLTRDGSIQSLAESGSPTTSVWSSTSGFSWPGKDPTLSVDFGNVSVSYDYGKTIGWEISKGRDFSRAFATDSAAVILNEAAIAYMGLKDPVGQQVTWWDDPLTIIGVVNDMVIESPYEEPRPLIYSLSNTGVNVVLAKLGQNQPEKKSLSQIETAFKKFSPDEPFVYTFTNDEYARKFGNEERVGKLAGFFALLAIIISCLGLFGLVSFVAEQRTKEIGIRKVLGASIAGLWQLLSKEFIWLVLIAMVIATPLSYYFMHEWLQHFEYRASLSWWIFPLAGAASLLITVLVVSSQAIRAALANPVKSLRTE